MVKILRIHEKILDHLLHLRITNSELYFAPRKINNKHRLEKGYWFLGNEDYLHLSFWNGEDWKEKIHNIGFVVLNNKTSFIELSAQDSPAKAEFLEKVAAKLGGFTKEPNKNKWLKHYTGTMYLDSLDDFLQNAKPKIDNLIKSNRPYGISSLDMKFFNRYATQIIASRQKQIEHGASNKLSRICWNTENWKFPSGSRGKSVAEATYEANAGFGHEEWLFDKSRLVEGYHYAFLRPLFLKSGKHENKTYDISLFTINNLNKPYFVGEIKNVECITEDESQRVHNLYQERGWLSQMKHDVARVGANHQKFSYTEPKSFFNIRFKFQNVIQPSELVEIAADDVNVTTNRYKLLPQKTGIALGTIEDENGEESEGSKKNTNRRKKVFNSDCEYDPYHDRMQNAIFELLKNSELYDYKKVFIEKDRVDIKAITKQNTWHFFELKTDNAKLSIRKGLGQILEYAYYPDYERAEKLIIVADEEPDKSVIAYLDHIRNKFNLPISYRHFNLETNILSDDY